MRRKTRTKVKKYVTITSIILGIILLIAGIIFLIKLSKRPTISYRDGLVGKNYFKEITIDLNTKEVRRDNIQSSLVDEFDISEEKANELFASEENMTKFLANSVFDISFDNNIYIIRNQYQTKSIMVKANEVKEIVEGETATKLADNLYLLEFFSEKMTKAMTSYYEKQPYIEKIYKDEIFIDQPLNDISQTMYGSNQVNLRGYHSLGTTVMGLDNYSNIINENGNPFEIIVSTIGYGIDYQNELFKDRISRDAYNFILNNDDIKETIPQGSRIAEILVNSTTSNVKILPLVTITEEGYTSLSSIAKALFYGIEKSDVICYELINTKHDVLDIILESAFKKNIPVCSVTSSEGENYPATHGMTIATSSIDRNFNLADYSGKGEYIDFTAPSTDVEEIFNSSTTVSRWSGPEYSNAQIVSCIALMKSYDKEATILDVYNFLRNYCNDIGDPRKR